jgi:hypothetical protein
MIKIVHYKAIDKEDTINKSTSLHIKKCTGCYIGNKEGNHCVININKKFSVLIKNRISDGLDEQQKRIVIIEQMIEDLIMDIKMTFKESEIPLE